MRSLWKLTWLIWSHLLVGEASDYEYVRWNGEQGYGKSHQCVEIPEDLRLCYTVGYSTMLLPNLLEHDSMTEVKQQAGSWVPLVHKGCHPGTQVLLCALFAPVCLDRPVQPCRWLCEEVRLSCSPIMEAFGFPWPEMLNCSKFPKDEVCVSVNATESSRQSDVCPPCDNEESTEALHEKICASEFAFKAKIKEVKSENTDRKVILQKRRKPVNVLHLKNNLKKVPFILKNGTNCKCRQLENRVTSYLMMGRQVGKQYLLTAIHKWDKKAIKKLKNHKCPSTEPIF
ncbi:secreted frizzled-related protein 1b [Denticeps clupeoides]|nr:secreted frizzled-related protein 1-like [Denticeps clupeoides]